MHAAFTGSNAPSNILRSLKLSATDARIFYAKFRMKHKPSPAHVVLCRVSFKNISIRWLMVTQVELTDISVDECCELLTLAPNLRHCTFSEVTEPDESDASTSHAIVVHQNFKDLKFDDPESEESERLFDRISCPSLQRLNINMDEEPLPIESLSAFLKRSSCALKELRLRQCLFYDDSLVAFLKEIPSLTKIDIFPHANLSHEPSKLFKALAETALPSDDAAEGKGPSSILLPNLQFFRYLADDKMVFPWTLLVPVFGPLPEISNSRRRPLQTVHIYFDRQDEPQVSSIIEKDVLSDILRIRQAGWELEVKSTTLDLDFIEASLKQHETTLHASSEST